MRVFQDPTNLRNTTPLNEESVVGSIGALSTLILPIDGPSRARPQFEQQLAQVLERHSDLVFRSLSRQDVSDTARSNFLRDLRQALGLRPEANISFDVTGSVDFSPQQTVRGVGHLTISAGRNELAECRLDFNGSRRPAVQVPQDSAIMSSNPPAWLRPLLHAAAPSPDSGSPNIALPERALEQERQRLARIHLPEPNHASPSAFLEDPGIRHLVGVFQELQRYSQNIPPGGQALLNRLSHGTGLTESRLVEMSTWISRMLVNDSLQPTAANIRSSVDTLLELHRTVDNVPVFAGRRIVVAAGGECVNEMPGNDSPANRSQVTVNHGDYHRFASRTFMRRLSEESGGSVSLFRPSADVDGRIQAALCSQSSHLGLLAIPEAMRNAVDSTRIDVLRANIRQALGLAHDANIRMTYTVSSDGRRGDFRVFNAESTTALFEATTTIANGRVTGLAWTSEYRLPEAHTAVTSEQARTRALDAIRTTPPGEHGFSFIFTGHGTREGIYLDGDANGGHARISPQDLANAIIARRERFGERTNNDVYMLFSCFSHDFQAEVGRLLQNSEARPYLHACTEFGQVGTEQIGRQISTPDFDAMLRLSRRDRENGSTFSIGDLIRELMRSNGTNNPNPSLLVPTQRPGQGQRRFYQISQEPFGRSRETQIPSTTHM